MNINSLSAAICASAILIFSCNNNSSDDKTPQNDTAMTSNIETRVEAPFTVKGPAGNLYVDDGGTGGIPVIFVHSFGGSTAHWQNQLQHLRSSRRAIAFDLRAHGQSDSSASYDYQAASLANDIAAVADSLHLDKFILVGHSMGGSAAINYAAKHPERVAGLLLTGTPGKTPEAQVKQIVSSLESEKYDTVMADYMNRLLKNATPATDAIERQGMNKLSKPTILAIIKAIFDYDPTADLRSYKGPVMIVSTSSEEQPGSLHKTFPSIPFRTVEGTSHWIQLDNPGEFNKALDEFLRTAEK